MSTHRNKTRSDTCQTRARPTDFDGKCSEPTKPSSATLCLLRPNRMRLLRKDESFAFSGKRNKSIRRKSNLNLCNRKGREGADDDDDYLQNENSVEFSRYAGMTISRTS